MAKPRVFLSSTCYDLKELRSQIRDFINNYGYDAILSEYGDIFFEYGTHPQDACFAEVTKCHMFLLIIGNTYGSFYHNQNTSRPSSVTMKEFEEALDKNIPKHVFINRFVEYDYQNYSRAWANKLNECKRDGQELADNKSVDRLKEEFNSSYPFPQTSYKHLFRFIDLIYRNNVSVITFEYAEDIKRSLTKQWAGAMYEYLTASKNTPNEYINELNVKIDRIKDTIEKMIEVKKESDGSNISFNLSSIYRNQDIETIEKIKEKVFTSLQSILPYEHNRYSLKKQRGQNFTESDIIQWLSELNNSIDVLKWRSYIMQEEVLFNLRAKLALWYSCRISPKKVATLCRVITTCKDSFSENEYQSLINAITSELNTMDYAIEDDDLPF